jgi:hypothetical protein
VGRIALKVRKPRLLKIPTGDSRHALNKILISEQLGVNRGRFMPDAPHAMGELVFLGDAAKLESIFAAQEEKKTGRRAPSANYVTRKFNGGYPKLSEQREKLPETFDDLRVLLNRERQEDDGSNYEPFHAARRTSELDDADAIADKAWRRL